jgi:hypothetical protein
MSTSTFNCDICKQQFAYKKSLRLHERNIHNIDNIVFNIVCPIENCPIRCGFYEKLDEHLSTEHNIVVESEEITFSNKDQFEEWRQNGKKRFYEQFNSNKCGYEY